MSETIPELFFLYAPDDFPVKEQIVQYLAQFERTNQIRITPDIESDQDTITYYKDAINRSRIVLMLWTSDFLADETLHTLGEYVADLHLQKMHNVLPVLVKQCLYDMSESYKQIKKIPRNGRALIDSNKNEVFQQIADSVAGLLYLFQLENKLEQANQTIVQLAKELALLQKK